MFAKKYAIFASDLQMWKDLAACNHNKKVLKRIWFIISATVFLVLICAML
jgi:hypothetical protein